MATVASRLLTQSAPSSHKHKNITTHTTFCGSSCAFFTLKKKSEKKHQVFCLLLHPLSLAASNKLLLHCSLFYHLTFTIRILLAFFPIFGFFVVVGPVQIPLINENWLFTHVILPRLLWLRPSLSRLLRSLLGAHLSSNKFTSTWAKKYPKFAQFPIKMLIFFYRYVVALN